MSIMEFIAIIGFVFACFTVGYTFGKNIRKTQK